jgi:DNA-binding MarR family transcriptional regulator
MTPTADRPADVDAETLADLEAHLVRFIRAFGLLQGDATPCGEPIPVSEAHAVTELATAGPMSQRELGDRLALTKGTVSRLAGILEARGWVRRSPSAADARALEVRLTAAGRGAATRVANRRRRKLADLLDALPATERHRVIEALALLAKAAG